MNATEATVAINKVLRYFNTTIKQLGYAPGKIFAQIEGVDVKDIVTLYNGLGKIEKRLYMPNELDTDVITVVIKPKPEIIIEITSVPVVSVKPKIKPLNLN